MIKLLIGGSPCTHWSIAQKKNRETEPSGLGWELFKNYLIAKDIFNPDYFFYENNKSAAPAIKEQIEKELGVKRMEINSALVSAQTRQRFYCFNWEIEQPHDRGIVLRDILENGEHLVNKEKSYALTSTYGKVAPRDTLKKASRSMVAVRVGDIGSTAQAHRVYSCDGKSICINANGGGQGAKTGLYLTPSNNGLYEVKDGLITVSGNTYPIYLEDGRYIIRKLTPTECERLQTLPDGYTEGISNVQRYKALGNGWTAEVIIHVLNGALKNVPKEEPIKVLSLYDGIAIGRYCLDKMGFKNVTYYAFEIDPYAMKVANKNYPDIIQLGDAFQIRDEVFLNEIREVLRE